MIKRAARRMPATGLLGIMMTLPACGSAPSSQLPRPVVDVPQASAAAAEPVELPEPEWRSYFGEWTPRRQRGDWYESSESRPLFVEIETSPEQLLSWLHAPERFPTVIKANGSALCDARVVALLKEERERFAIAQEHKQECLHEIAPRHVSGISQAIEVPSSVRNLAGNLNGAELKTLSQSHADLTGLGLDGATDADLDDIPAFSKLIELRIWTGGLPPGHPLPEEGITDAGLTFLRRMPELRYLELAGDDITDEGLQFVGAVSRLRELGLVSKSVHGEGLGYLRRLRQLERLELWLADDRGFGRAGLAMVGELHQLKTLHLHHRLNPNDLEAVGQLINLEHLRLNGLSVQDKHLEKLQRLQALQSLFIQQAESISGRSLHSLPAQLRHLSLDSANLDGEGMSGVAHLKELRTLVLTQCHVDDTGLRHLAGLNDLRRLDLAWNEFNGPGLAALKGLDQLRELTLDASQTGDDGLVHLASLSSLESLRLRYTRISGAGLKHLAELHSLRFLDIAGTVVGDAGVAHLTGLHSLQELSVMDGEISDAAIEHLLKLINLEELDIGLSKITGDGLVRLAALPKLRRLRLVTTEAVGDATVRFEELRPDVELTYYRPGP